MLDNTVRLAEVCSAAKDRCVRMTVSQRLLRKGPYPLYADNCLPYGIDDYAIEAGGCVMVPAYGSVVGSGGYVMARLEQGRCSATEAVHALVPHDRADAAYLYRMVTTSPAVARQVGGSPQLRQLPEAALLAARIPWPPRPVRDAFVGMMDDDEARARELAALVPELLARGDEAFACVVESCAGQTTPLAQIVTWHEGTNVPAADRAPDKPVRVEGPRGRLGRCDEAVADGPAVMVGPAGRTVVSHYVGEPSHPIAEMAFARACDCKVPLSVLLFALRAAGVYDDPRVTAHDPQHRVSPQGLAELAVCVGTEEARAAFAQVGDDILARLAQAERDADALARAHAERLATFFSEGAVEGAGPCGGALGAVPPAPAQRPDEQVSSADGAGLPAPDEALGALRPLVEEGMALLGNREDVAWELAPLVAVRVRAGASQWAFVRAAAGQWAAPGYASLVGALDTVMGELAQADDLLSFLPNLSYQSSLLSPSQLAAWVGALDALDPAQIGGAQMRALLAPALGAAPLPQSVAQVFGCALRCAAAGLEEGFEAGYVPYSAGEGVLDLFAAEFPQVSVRVQMPEFAQVLADMLVRAVQLCGQEQTRGGVGAAAGLAICSDEFPEWRAPLVAAALPDNAGEWSVGPVARDDPRWGVLGVPPRNKANFAWLQQALYHQAPGGATVLLAGNTVLYSTMGSEASLRQELAASGRVRAVVALPARIFPDGRAPMSLLVMGDEGCSGRVLMVNALDLADGGAAAGVRTLSDEAVARIGAALKAWLVDGACADEPGFCRVVDLDLVRAAQSELTPWSFV